MTRERFGGTNQSQCELSQAHRNRLVAGTPTHIADHGQKDGESDRRGERIRVDRDYACRDHVEDDVDGEPRQTSSRAGEQRHGAELFTTDDAANAEKVPGDPLARGLLDRRTANDTEQPADTIHYRHG